MNPLSKLILHLVSAAVVILCVGGAWIGLLAINSPDLWSEVFSDPKNAANATRMAAGAFVMFQALMGIVFAGCLSTLLSIEKNSRSQMRSPSGV